MQISPFASLPAPWSDPLFRIAAEAKKAGTTAIDGTIGIVLTEEGKPLVLPTVQNVLTSLATELTTAHFAYPPLLGLPEYRESVESLLGAGLFGSIATTGGTAGVAINLRLLRALLGDDVTLLLPQPTWVNHANICEGAGMEVKVVEYFSAGLPSLDGIARAIASTKRPFGLLLHAGCHNPTGLDFLSSEWKELALLLSEKRCAVLLDFAYQGLKNSPEEDAEPIRLLREAGVVTLVAWSASKNHSIYGLRTGLAAAAVTNEEEQEKVEGLYSKIARSFTSTAPTIGQHVVARTQQHNFDAWKRDLSDLRALLSQKRSALIAALPSSFHASLGGSGMFAVLPLTQKQILSLKEQHAVFLAPDGRINLSGIPMARIEELGDKIQHVL